MVGMGHIQSSRNLTKYTLIESSHRVGVESQSADRHSAPIDSYGPSKFGRRLCLLLGVFLPVKVSPTASDTYASKKKKKKTEPAAKL